MRCKLHTNPQPPPQTRTRTRTHRKEFAVYSANKHTQSHTHTPTHTHTDTHTHTVTQTHTQSHIHSEELVVHERTHKHTHKHTHTPQTYTETRSYRVEFIIYSTQAYLGAGRGHGRHRQPQILRVYVCVYIGV